MEGEYAASAVFFLYIIAAFVIMAVCCAIDEWWRKGK